MCATFADFTQKYSLSKTLRFALRPIARTKEFIDQKELLQEDEQRANDYKQVKKIIDEFHRAFIEDGLSGLEFAEGDLQAFAEAYRAVQQDKTNAARKTELGKLQDKLRTAAFERFKEMRGEPKYKASSGKAIFTITKKKDSLSPTKELIKDFLPKWLESQNLESEQLAESKDLVAKFKKWTSYFAGCNTNRKNIYTKEALSTGIAFRIVHDNLPKFIDNISRYKKAKELEEKDKELELNFSANEQNFAISLDEIFRLDHFNRCLSQKGIEQYTQILGAQGANDSEAAQGLNQKINLAVQAMERRIQKIQAGSKGADKEAERLLQETQEELRESQKALRACQMEELYKQMLRWEMPLCPIFACSSGCRRP